jgi:hypothetical protein
VIDFPFIAIEIVGSELAALALVALAVPPERANAAAGAAQTVAMRDAKRFI